MADKMNRYKKPRDEEKKDRTFLWRLTKSEMDDLDMLSYALDESKSDIMRKAFKMYFNANKGRF